MSKDCCVLVSEVLTRGGVPKQGMQVSRPTHLRYWVSHCWYDPFWFSYLLLNVRLIFQESGILAVLFERQGFITCMNTRAFEFHILTCLSPFAHVQWPWLPMGQWWSRVVGKSWRTSPQYHCASLALPCVSLGHLFSYPGAHNQEYDGVRTSQGTSWLLWTEPGFLSPPLVCFSQHLTPIS